jgi:hypothetical protein
LGDAVEIPIEAVFDWGRDGEGMPTRSGIERNFPRAVEAQRLARLVGSGCRAGPKKCDDSEKEKETELRIR